MALKLYIDARNTSPRNPRNSLGITRFADPDRHRPHLAARVTAKGERGAENPVFPACLDDFDLVCACPRAPLLPLQTASSVSSPLLIWPLGVCGKLSQFAIALRHGQ